MFYMHHILRNSGHTCGARAPSCLRRPDVAPCPESQRSSIGADVAKIDFLAPDLAMPFIHVGADILVLEGPKPVARAVVREVLRPAADQLG